jgi:sterol desaturase/sphingolipid hydroxylase (fatty acid hydroxylase superfamily)
MDLAGAVLEFFDIRALVLACLIFVPAERLLAVRKQQRVLRKSWRSDLTYVLVNRIFILPGIGLLILATGVIASWLVPVELRASVATQPLWLQVVEAIVVADFGFYVVHRLFHSVPWLWTFHAIHHSIEELDWLAAARVHPVDQIVTRGLSMVPLYALGFSGPAFGVFGAIYFWHSLLLHANVRLDFGPLGWLIASPDFHHWHHANQPEAHNKNYAGQLCLFDRLFGTAYPAAGRTPERYGVPDPVPNSYVAQLLYPLRARRAVSSRSTSDSPDSRVRRVRAV